MLTLSIFVLDVKAFSVFQSLFIHPVCPSFHMSVILSVYYSVLQHSVCHCSKFVCLPLSLSVCHSVCILSVCYFVCLSFDCLSFHRYIIKQKIYEGGLPSSIKV